MNRYRCFLLVRDGMKKSVIAVLFMFLAVMAVSCRSTKDIQTETKTEYVHDTTFLEIRDTTRIVSVKIDSVDRYIEKNVYVDSNGVVHEKEIERLTRYINMQDETYRRMQSYYQEKIEKLQSQLNQKQEVKEVFVKKDLSWFQKTLMWFGVGFVLVLIGFGISLYVKYKSST